MNQSWAARHFSLSNPEHDRPADLAYLLRRMADHIDELGVDPMEILDLTVHQEITADGPWWSATLYYSPDHSPDTTG
ncbi:hypothetical protein KIH74_09230 [Kineosporia sp. J2-2]|uniref:Uncharacterized protein n=1 Tax=Kineosporia corallincola TaxID=2835133 RepID=A0ABS5TDD5_9ACTN|nr:hypothetical protein [Kineosporia corallincola]MBT0769100.1 hypothetical protein [Kineosporia corallincola]